MNKVPDVQQPHLPKLTCLKDKVLRAMYRMYGPMCYPRLVNKQLKTIPARLIKGMYKKLFNIYRIFTNIVYEVTHCMYSILSKTVLLLLHI